MGLLRQGNAYPHRRNGPHATYWWVRTSGTLMRGPCLFVLRGARQRQVAAMCVCVFGGGVGYAYRSKKMAESVISPLGVTGE
ncbi:hypothetical protein B296_00029399 [Ensete ventricosum]|uniref:Uncharacterized protein n=1 Tax=Ensete ventricosum TaxID=4639 RepID=A0A426ZI12_ENSVE|nr:hypothetical protein B296_00029399 [Ensete ventricosum]